MGNDPEWNWRRQEQWDISWMLSGCDSRHSEDSPANMWDSGRLDHKHERFLRFLSGQIFMLHLCNTGPFLGYTNVQQHHGWDITKTLAS